MPQSTSATFSRVERAGPGERNARSDRPPSSIGRRTRRISTNAVEPIRSGRDDAGFGWGGAGTLPRVAEGEVRENLPDNRGIVQRGDQPEAASTTRHTVCGEAKHPVTNVPSHHPSVSA